MTLFWVAITIILTTWFGFLGMLFMGEVLNKPNWKFKNGINWGKNKETYFCAVFMVGFVLLAIALRFHI